LRLGPSVRQSRTSRARRILIAAGCAVFVTVLAACNITPPSSPPKVILYGDSLSVEAESTFVRHIEHNGIAQAVTRVQNNTAICDWFDEMENDLQTIRPFAVVFEFAGNSAPSCVANSGMSAIDKYQADAQHAIDIFRTQAVHVYLVATPLRVTDGGVPENPDPFRDMYFNLVVNNGIHWSDAGHAVFNAQAGLYLFHMPCNGEEISAGFCHNGLIQVRDSSDGLHFCPSGRRPLPCDVNFDEYVGGAVRFGNAMAGQVVTDLGF
jgi:hypothetical protein